MNNLPVINPVLLAGGSGKRLWPLSRKSYPKQFSDLVGDKTLFQQSALRMVSSELISFGPHITITNSAFRFIVSEQLQEANIDPGPILIEPEAKNTAPAILAASLFARSKNEDAVLLVAPSDHIIPDKFDFHEAISVGLSLIEAKKLVTFGIQPTHPETAYGYLEISKTSYQQSNSHEVVKFIEKPARAQAVKMLESGNFLWNAGIFLFKAKDMIEAFEAIAPETLKLVSHAFEIAYADLGFLRLGAEPWSKLSDVSVDYAIIEKVQNLVAVPYTSKWSDLGGWDAVWAESKKDVSGNAISERAHAIDCSNTLLRSENLGQQIVGLGIDNIVAISMPDAVLIANKNRAQDVKKAVKVLIENKIPQAEIFPKDFRPWGWFESLAIGDNFQVKRICVKPSASLSLQSHKFRSEHWVVVKGTAKTTIGNDVKLINEGESVYVPLGAIHRMENPGQEEIVIIEVQIGSYLGEDDITRYQDQYSRTKTE